MCEQRIFTACGSSWALLHQKSLVKEPCETQKRPSEPAEMTDPIVESGGGLARLMSCVWL